MRIDALIFNNELDVLEIRLGTLYDHVDAFVIVESLGHHGSANRKEHATLAEHWREFERWHDKMDYNFVSDLRPEFKHQDDAWPRENYHRNLLKEHVLRLSERKDDIVMISDCDEIPRPEAIPNSLDKTFAFAQDFFYYDVNTYKGLWNGTVVTTRGQLEQTDVQYFRDRRDTLPRIQNGGWHFSYFGGTEMIRNKVKNFAHSDMYDRIGTDEEITEKVNKNIDLYNRQNETASWRSTSDPRLPKYFLERTEYFKHLTKVTA
jgi:beta-1,4-mannosyl-glycoprotein beta-1,4-N-acetylglucosaminyltransferase